MKRDKAPGPVPAESGPVVVQQPSTVADWRSRIGELQQYLADVERSLTAKAAARKKAAGCLLLGIGGTLEAVEDLEREESKLDHEADGLRAAIELAEHEVKRIETAERQARVEAQRARRQAVSEQIRVEATAADALLVELASRLQAIKDLLRRYQVEGGQFSRSLPSCAARAALHAGLHDLLDLGFVGGTRQHWLPLRQQLGAVAVAPGADGWAVDVPPAP
jgi:hypothetical protein